MLLSTVKRTAPQWQDPWSVLEIVSTGMKLTLEQEGDYTGMISIPGAMAVSVCRKDED